VDDSQWTWRVAWLLCLVLLWLTWAGGMDAPFVYDDRVEVFPLQDRTFSFTAGLTTTPHVLWWCSATYLTSIWRMESSTCGPFT
jgi:hypothetical protein